MAVEPPTGTVSVVECAIVGASRLWQHRPDAMSAAVERLAGLTTKIAADLGVFLPSEAGGGDTIVATATLAQDAASFAIALAAAVDDEPWPEELALALRTAIHTGEVQWSSDAGYVGPAFSRASQLRDLGHAGQILVSQTTRELLDGRLETDVLVEDLGSHQLRDLSRTEHVFQLRPIGDQTVYAPLKSVTSLANNLPVPVTSLVGRDRSIFDIAALFREQRLVTLTGPGGAGKTRLAQHVASVLLSTAPDGAWWVDLMPVSEAPVVPLAIAAAAGIEEVTGKRSLAAGLGDREMLLVLDNCEHVIDAVADTVEILLAGCPNVHVLATSRETLAIDGEHAVQVEPLTTPEPDAVEVVADLTAHEATRLFVERAAAAGPFEPTDADARAIATICDRLDGIPLAIELAAARTRILPVAEIASGLDDRFTLLDATSRRRSSRQRTLEASVAWSFDLLDEIEQDVLCRLSTFPAAFSLDGAASVGTLGAGGVAPLQVLTSLVDKSLVAVRPRAHGRRYRLLETIREYAYARLQERGETEAARDAHLEHLLAVMERRTSQIPQESSDRRTWDDWAAWGDDVRAAASWALHRGRPEAVVDLYWPNAGRLLEYGGWPAALRALLPLAADERIEGRPRARLDAMQGVFLAAAGDPANGLAAGERAVAWCREHGDDEMLPFALYAVALAAPYAGRGTAGSGAAAEALAMGVSPSRGFESIHGTALATSLVAEGRWSQVVEHADRAAAAADARGGSQLGLMAASAGCIASSLRGDLVDGLERSRAVVQRMRLEGPRLQAMHAATGGLWPHVATGNLAEARLMVESASVGAGPPGTLSRLYAGLARANMAVHERDAEQLVQRAETALQVLRLGSNRLFLQIAVASLALGQALQGRTEEAAGHAEEARQLLPAGSGFDHGAGVLTMAELELAEGPQERLVAAARWLTRGAGEDGQRAGWTPVMVLAAADALLASGRPHDAAEALAGLGALLERFSGTYAWWPHGEPGPVAATLAEQLGADERSSAETAGARRSHDEVARRIVDLAGLHMAADHVAERPAIGWGALTSAEEKVARLVAQGMTNREVGDVLFVSENTIKSHLKSVYNKLSISSRTELATRVATELPADPG